MAVCQAGLFHHAPAVSTHNVVRHEQNIQHEVPVHYTASHAAPAAHAAPAYRSESVSYASQAVHAAPAYQAVHAAPVEHEAQYVDEYVSFYLRTILIYLTENTKAILISSIVTEYKTNSFLMVNLKSLAGMFLINIEICSELGKSRNSSIRANK